MTTPEPTGPVVNIIGREGGCRYGSNCLIAAFTIERFDGHPAEYVCEFADGSRYTFRFDRNGTLYACATGNPNGSITIEVDGIRSQTFAPHAAG